MSKDQDAPYMVTVVDQLQGHDEDGLGAVKRNIKSLEQAVSLAARITDEAFETAGSYERWQEIGKAALVYDKTSLMVWDGIIEVHRKHAEATETNE